MLGFVALAHQFLITKFGQKKYQVADTSARLSMQHMGMGACRLTNLQLVITPERSCWVSLPPDAASLIYGQFTGASSPFPVVLQLSVVPQPGVFHSICGIMNKLASANTTCTHELDNTICSQAIILGVLHSEARLLRPFLFFCVFDQVPQCRETCRGPCWLHGEARQQGLLAHWRCLQPLQAALDC